MPSDLCAHYSSLAFRTRLAALTFVGAAVGAEVAWTKIGSVLLGTALLVIVASLGELNRRYTWSYRSACRAAATAASTREWRDFLDMNEGPWTFKPRVPRYKQLRCIASRFFLNWSTYLPGVVAGIWLVKREGQHWQFAAAIIGGLGLCSWWLFDSVRRRDPAPSS